MENIEKFIARLQEKHTAREEQLGDEEKKQLTEYNNLMHKLQAVKDERNDYKDNISKNLQRLTQHNHSIYKLTHNSENITGLPVSHNYHRQAVTFLTEGINLINKLQNLYEDLDNGSVERDINPTNLVRQITTCTNSIGTELYKTKSLITEVNTLKNNTEILLDYCLDNDEDMDD